MLDVVEHDQERPCAQVVVERTLECPAAALAHVERLGDRGDDVLGLRDRRQWNKERAVREVSEHVGCSLQRQARLPRAPRPGQRDDAVIVAPQAPAEVFELPLAADQRRRLCWQVRRSQVEGVQRREVLGEAGRDHLEDPVRLQEVLQPVRAEIAKRDVVERLLLEQLARRLRNKRLTAVTRRADARGAVNADPHIAVWRRLRLTGVDADADLQRLPLRPGVRSQRALTLYRSRHRVFRRVECNEEGVALCVHLMTGVGGERGSQQLAVSLQCLRIVSPELAQQPRRALHVGEEEGHRSTRPVLFRSRDDQNRILVEDLPLQLLQRRARLDSKLVHQSPSPIGVDVQGLRLPTGAVQRQHQKPTQTFLVRMSRDELFQFAEELEMLSELQPRFCPVRQGCKAELIQPRRFRRRERLVPEVRQRLAPKQLQRLPEALRSPRRIVLAPRFGQEAFEPMDVDGGRVDAQPVSRRVCLDQAATEPLAERGHVALQGGLRRLRGRGAPEGIDEVVSRDDLICTKEEEPQQHPLLWPRGSQVAPVGLDPQRPEQPEVHVTPILARIFVGVSGALAQCHWRVSAELHSLHMDSRRALTAVERRVAALVAMGEAIPDVAVELGLARKSVDWHLSRVYRKLGVSSRRELLAALAAPGREEISDA